jgi:hypothetical protein
LVAGAVAGCGDDADDPSATSERSTTTTATATPSDEPVDVSDGGLPPSPSNQLLDHPHTGYAETIDEAAFGVAVSSVTARWYRLGRYYAVYFDGLTRQQAEGKCLAVVGHADGPDWAGFGEGACEGMERVQNTPGALHLCGDEVLILETHIPVPAAGPQRAQISEVDAGREMTAGRPIGVAEVPAIDVSGCETIG